MNACACMFVCEARVARNVRSGESNRSIFCSGMPFELLTTLVCVINRKVDTHSCWRMRLAEWIHLERSSCDAIAQRWHEEQLTSQGACNCNSDRKKVEFHSFLPRFHSTP